MTPHGSSSLIGSILSTPGRWIVNIVRLQEKKTYSFHVILLFAFFVGITRYTLEWMLGYRPLVVINASLLQVSVFYLHAIFLYTLILRIFVPEQSWKKSINIVLIGVFLGLFPPIIDAFIYGTGGGNYRYSTDFIRDWRPLLLNEEIGFIFGEVLVLFLTMFFTAVVVYIKTRKPLRAAAAFLFTYGVVVFMGMILPTIVKRFTPVESLWRMSGPVEYTVGVGEFYSVGGFALKGTLTLCQVLLVVAIYLVLNPTIAWNLLKRVNHAIPCSLTCLIGYTLLRPVDGYGVAVTSLVLFAFFVGIVQNDFFDRVEDTVEGRPAYLTRDDVAFFTTMMMLLAATLIAAGNVVGYFLLLGAVVSILYNYDFYRGKKYFPTGNKIEGVAGVCGFLAGLCMAFVVNTEMAGDILHIEHVGVHALSGALESMRQSLAELWSVKHIWMAFLMFGGWSVVSILKDYKGIEGDTVAGNQTVYTMLRKRGKDITRFHTTFCLVIFLLLAVPAFWFVLSGLGLPFAGGLMLVNAAMLFAVTRRNARWAVQSGFMMLSFYLLWIIVGNQMLLARLPAG